MAKITLHRKPIMKKLFLPLWVLINEQPVGLMRGDSVTIELPEGSYNISVKLLFQLWKYRFGIEGSRIVTASDEVPVNLKITDRERLWNILFDIDLVVWIASFFFTLPEPWNWVYHILSDGFFVVWIIRLVIIRKRYFILAEK